MADQYVNEFFLDPDIVKQEPFITIDSSSLSTTASVPIPTRRYVDLSELREYGIEVENIGSPTIGEGSGSGESSCTKQSSNIYQSLGGNAMWGTRLIHTDTHHIDTFRMDDDDIFQVDKADLIQGPTLAELNANDDTLLEDLNFDDLLLPEENSYSINIPIGSQLRFPNPSVHITNLNNTNISNNNCPSPNTFTASSCPQTGLGFYKDLTEPSSSVPSSPFDPFSPKSTTVAFSPTSQHSSTSSLVQASSSPPPQPTVVRASTVQQRHSTLHELLLKRDAHSGLGRSAPGQSAGSSGIGVVRTGRVHSSRLSSSAPTHLGLEQIWQRREPRKHLLSTGSLAEAGSTSSLSTGGVLSPEANDFSHDEGFDSDEDSEHYEDVSSENDSDDEGGGRRHSISSVSKKERFFWQYNVQAKGPKGQRLVLKTKLEDPHVLNEVTDPVFSPNCSVRGIKHSGKARKGDGNDLTPNPRKLHNIGKELDKLGKIINDMTPVSELPFNVRPKTRKEKNKLASRACRLKKKAQHEANKIKLYGLEHEHKRLINGIAQIKQVLKCKFSDATPEYQEELTKHMEKIVKSATKVRIAGHSTEYVNKVLEKIKNGVPGGGLDEF